MAFHVRRLNINRRRSTCVAWIVDTDVLGLTSTSEGRGARVVSRIDDRTSRVVHRDAREVNVVRVSPRRRATVDAAPAIGATLRSVCF